MVDLLNVCLICGEDEQKPVSSMCSSIPFLYVFILFTGLVRVQGRLGGDNGASNRERELEGKRIVSVIFIIKN